MDGALRGSGAVVMAIRKLNFAPAPGATEAPSDTITKKVGLAGAGPITMTVALDREVRARWLVLRLSWHTRSEVARRACRNQVYCHGEPIAILVKVDNSSKKNIKNMEIFVRQLTTVKTDASLSGLSRKCHVAELKDLCAGCAWAGPLAWFSAPPSPLSAAQA
jgi:hypothetical protein